MNYILSVDDRRFYWNQATNQVMYTDDDEMYSIIGYAKSSQEAKEVVMEWL